jgi:integrase/recombinase XerC
MGVCWDWIEGSDRIKRIVSFFGTFGTTGLKCSSYNGCTVCECWNDSEQCLERFSLSLCVPAFEIIPNAKCKIIEIYIITIMRKMEVLIMVRELVEAASTGQMVLADRRLVLYDLICKWLDSTRSIQTRRSYRFSVQDFFRTNIEYITFEMVKAVMVADVEGYLDYLIERNLKSSTIKARLSACSSFYDYLLSFRSNEQDIKLLNFNPFKNGIIKQEKAKKITKHDAQITETLTDDELKRLYQTIDATRLKGIRDYAIIKVMVNGALRRSELVNLRIKDFYERDFEYWLHIEQGKGNKNRDNFINAEVVKAVEKYLSVTGRSIKDRLDDYIFKGLSVNGLNGEQLTTDAVKQLIERYCRKAGITKRISPHSFRHKTVTTLLENKVKPELVMEFCGHSSLNTTMRYWHNMDKVKNNAGRNVNL